MTDQAEGLREVIAREDKRHASFELEPSAWWKPGTTHFIRCSCSERMEIADTTRPQSALRVHRSRAILTAVNEYVSAHLDDGIDAARAERDELRVALSRCVEVLSDAANALEAATTIGTRSCRDGDHLNYSNHDRIITRARSALVLAEPLVTEDK